MPKVDELKKALSVELAKGELDYSQVLVLANELAKLDEDNVRFSVDASHISRLGIELVSKQETAVAELIKNAFDADATIVELFFKNTQKVGGSLEIVDNGNGMSHEELLNGFMRISTQGKVQNPVSIKFGRQRAGRKGIGRFASQRLGRSLEITTKLEDATHALQLGIDWNQFEGGKDLYLIASKIKTSDSQKVGTTLDIVNLRDVWTEAQILRTYRYVASLLQPFPLNKLSSVPSSVKELDPGFKVTIFREQDGNYVPVAGEDESIFPHALAKIIGKVDSNGVSSIAITSEKYKLNFEKKISDLGLKLKKQRELLPDGYSELAGVQFSAHYFIADELPSGTRSMVREMLNSRGGIRVYRNGFRVLPYGENFDDWLGLQRSSALREVLPPHHNTNFLGFVEIEDIDGTKFEETASREGLLENTAFVQLQDFVYRALMAAVIEIARARNKKLYASDPPTQKEEKVDREPKQTAKDIADEVRAFALAAATQQATSDDGDHEGSKNGPDTEESANDSTREKAEKLASKIEQFGQDTQFLLEENGMLRVLASLGLTIGEFTHEVRHTLAGLNAAISLLNQRIGPNDPLSPTCVSIKNNMELLQSYVRYFDEAVTENAHRELKAHEMRDLIGDFSQMIGPTLRRQGIELTVNFQGYDLFCKPMHRSEWASVFLNLFTNSLKAIHRAGSRGKIDISVKIVDARLRIEFSDNGDGIPDENSSKIFDPFFTTSSPVGVMASDSEKLVGTGLGLKIVRDILDAVNGEIEVVPPPEGYSTCLCIELPLAKEEEIEDGLY